ncbi:MAG: nicotinate phosphoribosyltransferase [Clostridiales bacterium]|nr:nicotinate phosphoribosyltransferase [Clostridiales bacterium]
MEAFRPQPSGRFFSATHEEIRRGLVADIYFVKTMAALEAGGLKDTPVMAEIFASRPGYLAGVEEVLHLLEGRPVEVWSLDEGEPFEAKEVVMRLKGPYGAFGIHETAILGILASSSAWLTAAREVKTAAGDTPVICFGSRHIHPAVAPVMERAALLAGLDGASNILGAKLFGKEPQGTIPHAFILIVGDTVEAARLYDRALPPEEPRTILVDTFKDEAEEALRVAAALGERLAGVRLDTPSERGGVTPELVREVRARLDQAGFRHVKIFVSGGVTPEKIPLLKAAGADGFGVGSYISRAAPIDMTMDLKEIDGRPVAKRGRIPGATPTERLKKKR